MRKEWGLRGGGVHPEGPSGGGQPDVRQEHPELPAGPRLRRTGRVLLPPGLLDRHEHADTATARPGGATRAGGDRASARARRPCAFRRRAQRSGQDCESCMSHGQSEEVPSS